MAVSECLSNVSPWTSGVALSEWKNSRGRPNGGARFFFYIRCPTQLLYEGKRLQKQSMDKAKPISFDIRISFVMSTTAKPYGEQYGLLHIVSNSAATTVASRWLISWCLEIWSQALGFHIFLVTKARIFEGCDVGTTFEQNEWNGMITSGSFDSQDFWFVHSAFPWFAFVNAQSCSSDWRNPLYLNCKWLSYLQR